MMVFRPLDRISVAAGPAGTRLIILGGASLGGPHYIWWNFVASSLDRIEAAKEEWRPSGATASSTFCKTTATNSRPRHRRGRE
jgi:redox-sensitive bicupin YhaK (pirin superfamily)